MPEPTDAALAAELRDLGRLLDVPPPPELSDLRATLRARLSPPGPAQPGVADPGGAEPGRAEPGGAEPGRAGSGRAGPGRAGPGGERPGRRGAAVWRWPVPGTWPARVAAVAAALAVLVAAVAVSSPRARAAISDFFRIGPIRVHSGPAPVPLPPATSGPAPRFGELLPGTRTSTLAEAEARATFPVGVPVRLGAPDEVLVSDTGRPTLVALRYAAGAGRPPVPGSAVAIELDEVAGRTSVFAEKYLIGDTRVRRVDVGDAGWWIPAPHELLYADASGQVRDESARLAGRTLIWQRGSVTYRLEGAFSEQQAVAIARSVP